MFRRRASARRSAVEWAGRGLLALAAAAAGHAAVTRSVAWVIRGSDPQRAHALAPEDGRITGSYAQEVLGVDATPPVRIRAAMLARRALQQDPTVVAAVSTLGLTTQLRGDTVGARRLFAYSEALSRRDLRTQVWAIEDAVGRGNVAGALRHYDTALRTTRNAPDLLFPILVSAIADPPIRTALVRTLAQQPLWTQPFIEYTAGAAPDPRVMASLFGSLAHARVPVSGHARAAAVDALARGGFFDQAWAYYRTIRPGVDRRVSRDPQFTGDPATPSPFDWALVNQAGIAASIQADSRGGAVDISAPGSIGGAVLRQMQMLPAGAYVLEGHATPFNQPKDSRPYWTLACLDGRELNRVALPGAERADGTFAGRFVVPPGCPVQYLSLVVRPSDRATGVSGQIDRVRLGPARQEH